MEETHTKAAKRRAMILQHVFLFCSVFALYFPSLRFGYTYLDDATLISSSGTGSSIISNLIQSFTTGALTGRHFYRPVLLDSYILNKLLIGNHLWGYHVVNILLHSMAVLLVFRLYKAFKLPDTVAFVLALLFAVHPLNVQAVSWLPGRNESLLAIFLIGFVLIGLKFFQNGGLLWLAGASVLFFLAAFTKETGLLAPIFLFLVHSYRATTQRITARHWVLYSMSGAVSLMWWWLRSRAHLAYTATDPISALKSAAHHLPLLAHYVGKLLWPWQLSVYPTLADTALLPGVAALVLLIWLVYKNSQRNSRMVWLSLSGFLLFVVPLLAIPPYMSVNTFEHRAYLPVIMLLPLVYQAVPVGVKYNIWAVMALVPLLVLLLAARNWHHQQAFASPQSFWQNAVATSPRSATAHAVYACYVADSVVAYAHLRTATQLNPNNRHLAFREGYTYFRFGNLPAAELAFKQELSRSGMPECYKYLHRIAQKMQDSLAAEAYLRAYTRSRAATNKQ
jgi:protein O-mannosyl-transferase